LYICRYVAVVRFRDFLLVVRFSCCPGALAVTHASTPGPADNTHYEIGMHVHWAVASGYITRVFVRSLHRDSWRAGINNRRNSFAASFCSRVYANETQRPASVLCERQTGVLRVHSASVKRIGVEIHRERYVDSIFGNVMKNQRALVVLQFTSLIKHKHPIRAG
jgi:hypothetical protein